MDQLGVLATRVGGVKFADEIVTAIGLTTQHNDVIAWLAAFHFAPGGDGAENALGGLTTAAQQAPGAFVVLATDDTYHESDEVFSGSRQQVAALLAAAANRVHIDPGLADLRDYWPLAVNGTVEDARYSYTYPKLRAELEAQ